MSIQYSNMYAERGHRLFSYFLMKSLLSGKKNIAEIYLYKLKRYQEKWEI